MNKKSLIEIIFGLTIFTAAAVFANFRSPNAFDYDSFYHIRHAWLYRAHGIFDTSFPWAQYSMVRVLGGDLWYGFHILLIPFTYFTDLIVGIKAAGVVITTAILSLYYLALKSFNVKFPVFWTMFFLFSTADILFRMAMMRPHPLSLGLAMLFFASCIGRSIWPAFIISFIFALVHVSLVWLIMLILFVVVCVERYNCQPIHWGKIASSAGGILAGIFLRPHPVATLHLAYIQVIRLMIEKFNGVPLRSGNELQPLEWIKLLTQISPLLVATFLVLVVLYFIRKKMFRILLFRNVPAQASLIMAGTFLIMTFFAVRAMEIFVGLLVIFTALMVTAANCKMEEVKRFFKKRLLWAIFSPALFIFIAGNSIYISRVFIRLTPPADRFKEAALWLSENSRPGEIVYHIYWEHFPALFFWNQNNYYINGMDPIFMYAYNPSLYWETDYWARKRTADITCGAIYCTQETLENTYDVLASHFYAAYVLVQPSLNPAFYKYLSSDAKDFKKVFDNTATAVFKLMPEPIRRVDFHE